MKRYATLVRAVLALSIVQQPEIATTKLRRLHLPSSVAIRKHRHSGVAAVRRAKRKGKR